MSLAAILTCLFLTTSSTAMLQLDTSKIDPIDFSVSNAGATAVSSTFYLINDSRIPKGDYLNIVFPGEFPSLPGLLTCQISGSVHPCVATASHTLKITTVSDIRAGVRIAVKVSGLTTPSSAGGTGYFQVFSMHATGGQIISKNPALGTVGFAPQLTGATGTIMVSAVSSFKTGATAIYILTMTVKTTLGPFSAFRIVVPAEFLLSTPMTCSSLAAGSTPAVSGSFVCVLNAQENAVYIYGLSQSVASSTTVSFSFGPVQNPGVAQTAGVSTFYIDSLRTGSHAVIDRAAVPSPAIIPNLIKATISAYSPGGKFTQNNVLLTSLSLTLTNPVPEGGFLSITYGANVSISPGIACISPKGLPMTSSGGFPVCSATDGSPNVICNNFGQVSANAQITVLCRLTLGTTNLPAVQISTYTMAGSIIDSDNGLQAAVTLLSQASFLQSSSSVTFPTNPSANSYGNVVFTVTPTLALPIGSVLTIQMSAGFSVTGTLICQQNVQGGTGTFAVSCSLIGSTVTVTTITDIVPLGNAVTITLKTAGTGLTFPSLGSSISSPGEWCVDVKMPGTSTFDNSGCMTQFISPAQFSTGTGLTGFSSLSISPNAYAPITFSIKFGVTLSNVSGSARVVFAFGTKNQGNSGNAFALDLGTGMSAGASVPFVGSSSIVALNPKVPVTLTLTPATSAGSGNNVLLTLSGFATLTAGTVITVETLLLTPVTPSQVDNPISITGSYIDTLGTLVTTETCTLLFSTGISPGTFSISSLTPRTVLGVSASTSISTNLQLSGVTDSTTSGLLLFLFPAGWVIPTSVTVSIGSAGLTIVKTFANSYRPGVLFQLTTTKKIPGTGTGSSVGVTIGGIFNPFCMNLGAGTLIAGVIDTSNSAQLVYSDYIGLLPNLASATSSVLSFQVTSTSFSQSAWDVTWTITIKGTNPYPAGSSVKVTFPTGFDLTYSNCDFSMNINDLSENNPAICGISGLSATLSSYGTITASQVFNINVRVVKNPTLALTGSFQVSVFAYGTPANLIETLTTGVVANLNQTATPVNATAPTLSFYPGTVGATADFEMSFSLPTAVPNGGSLLITFPSMYTLPLLTGINCLFNYQYQSCSQSGGVVTIVPLVRYSAGSFMTLKIPYMTVPPLSAANSSVKISIVWLGLSICTTPNSFNFTFTPAIASQTNLVASVNFYPQNAGETARYEFTLTPDSPFASSMSLLIWFPTEYPGTLGVVSCKSPMASDNSTQLLTCVNPSNIGYLVLTGFGNIPAKTSFLVILEGIMNPGTSGSTSNFVVATLLPTGAFQDVKSTVLQLNIGGVPGYLLMKGLNVGNSDVKELTNYTVVFAPGSVTPPGCEIWIRFPGAEFTNQFLAYGETFTCSGNLLSTPATSWYTGTPTCINNRTNLITIQGSNAGYNSLTDALQININGLKSPSLPGVTHTITTSIYNPTTKLLLSRNYGPETGNDTLTLTTLKHQVIVDMDDEVVVLTPGIGKTFNLHMDSEKMPSRQVLNFTATVVGSHDTSGLVVAPNPVFMNIGAYSVLFNVTVGSQVLSGDYILKWTIWGDVMNLYTGIAYTILRIDPNYLFTVYVPTIPTLMVGLDSIPFYLTLDVIPLSSFVVTFNSSLSTVTPTVATFSSLSSIASFTIYVTNTTTARTATMTVSLQASCCFQLNMDILYLAITNYDATPPEIAAFVIANPKGHLYTDITFQTTESATLIYIHGNRGLIMPSNDTLALDMAETATVVYIGNTFKYNFQLTGQVAETDYVMYGIMMDMNQNYMANVFAILYTTAGICYVDLYDSVGFSLTFTSPVSPTAIENVVIPALKQQMAIPASSQ